MILIDSKITSFPCICVATYNTLVRTSVGGGQPTLLNFDAKLVLYMQISGCDEVYTCNVAHSISFLESTHSALNQVAAVDPDDLLTWIAADPGM